MKVRRTKKQLIAAIETALKNKKLGSGSWIDGEWTRNEQGQQTPQICQVCAVGAVFMDCVEAAGDFTFGKAEGWLFDLIYGPPKGSSNYFRIKSDAARIALNLSEDEFSNAQITGGSQCVNWEKLEDLRTHLLKTKNWFGLLTNVFETEYAKLRNSTDAAREAIKYIEANFPKSITVDINGFTPKAGIRVVKERKKSV